MNDIVERINIAYQYLHKIRLVSTKKDLAHKMGYNYTNITSALKGSNKYLTESFIKEFNKTFGNMFNERWLFTGEGEMLNDNKCILKDNSAIVNGSGNSVVSGENNKLEISKCQDDLEVAMREIQYLKDIIKEKDKRIEEKDKHLADKERLINILMNK
ncbi:hypothetical protein [Phocaeicola sp.]